MIDEKIIYHLKNLDRNVFRNGDLYHKKIITGINSSTLNHSIERCSGIPVLNCYFKCEENSDIFIKMPFICDITSTDAAIKLGKIAANILLANTRILKDPGLDYSYIEIGPHKEKFTIQFTDFEDPFVNVLGLRALLYLELSLSRYGIKFNNLPEYF